MRRWAAIGMVIATGAMAQPAPVELRLDSTVIRIGEQVDVRINVVLGPAVDWPAIGDTLTAHVEVVHDHGVDTADVEGVTRQVRRLSITSFDTGFWAIPPFRLRVGGYDVETEALLLQVRGVPLDSTMVLRDIHGIVPTPFDLGIWLEDNRAWIAGGLAALALVAGAILWWRKRPRTAATPGPVVVEVAMHDKALRALAALEQERLWQQGLHKEYQSRLTDVLRTYIEQRYQVPAMEHPTDELLQDLRVSALQADQHTMLANMLRMADMVKFAKALPSPQENEQLMASAVRFVQGTRLRDDAPAGTSTNDHA